MGKCSCRRPVSVVQAGDVAIGDDREAGFGGKFSIEGMSCGAPEFFLGVARVKGERIDAFIFQQVQTVMELFAPVGCLPAETGLDGEGP